MTLMGQIRAAQRWNAEPSNGGEADAAAKSRYSSPLLRQLITH
jgi:hypothetical protein